MNAQKNSFLIPELKVMANDSELRKLQHNMLNDYYKKQMAQKQQVNDRNNIHQRSRSLLNQQRQNQTYLSDSYAYLKQDNPEAKFKQEMIRNYEQQLRRKQENRRREKMREQEESMKTYEAMKAVAQRDRIRTQQLNNQIRKQAIDQVQEKQLRKTMQKQQIQEQKKNYQRQYSTNLLTMDKYQSFKDHYHNVQNALLANQEAYKHNVVPLNQYLQQEKQRLIDNGIKQNQEKLRRNLVASQNADKRYRDEFRETLIRQIREKQDKKKRDIDEQRAIKYTSNDYLKVHHPINNPVDFRMTHDNKYIIGQLQSKLARSGSQSLV